MSKEDFQDGYDRGFEEGLKTADFSEAYWLRSFAGQVMQGIMTHTSLTAVVPENNARLAVEQAQALLAEVKKCEAENGN